MVGNRGITRDHPPSRTTALRLPMILETLEEIAANRAVIHQFDHATRPQLELPPGVVVHWCGVIRGHLRILDDIQVIATQPFDPVMIEERPQRHPPALF